MPGPEEILADLDRAQSLGVGAAPESLLAQAIRLAEKDKEAAISLLQKARTSKELPPNEVLLKMLGDFLAQARRLEEARAAYDEAVGQRANYALAYYARGMLSADTRESDWRTAVEIAPDLWLAWEALAEFLSSRNPSEALGCFLRVIRLQPKLESPYYAAGTLMVHGEGKWPEGTERTIEQAVLAAPGNPYAWVTHHTLRSIQERFPEALASLVKARELLAGRGSDTTKTDARIAWLRERIEKDSRK